MRWVIMKITKQELIDLNACKAGLDRFIEQTNNTDEAVDVGSLVGGKNTYHDLLWLAGKKLSKDKIRKFACDCALINIELIKPCTDKYNLILEFLNGRNEYAADAAVAVADAARAADAAVAVAVADADAADAADAAAFTATVAAAPFAVYDADGNKIKVNELLKELLGGVNNE